MKRTRNIILWSVTALFFAGAMFFVGLINMGVMIFITVLVVPAVVLMMVFKPEKMGIAQLSHLNDSREIQKFIFPAVFQVELRLESMNLPKVIRIPIDKPEFTIGRSRSCDFSIEDNKRLSGRHITIRFNPHDHIYSVVDHNTTNGTFLNHDRIPPEMATVIQKNDVLELPGIVFKVRSAYS